MSEASAKLRARLTDADWSETLAASTRRSVSWVETEGDLEQRRFEVDFTTGKIGVAGRHIACDRHTLHPKIPFPLDLVAGAKDAHLWLSHAAPPSPVRAEQNLVTKDDPQVVIDVTPRGAVRAVAGRASKGSARAGGQDGRSR